MSGDQVTEYAEKIRSLLTERLRIKGRTLEAQIHKSGRRLPRKIKRDASFIAKAEGLSQNPKLVRMVDAAAVEKAGRRVVEHLLEIDPKEALKDRILWALGKAAAVVILIFIGAVWYANSKGMI